jgi:exodeoxyribonuclease VII large subunit
VIGVVTSPTGAVIRDIVHRLAERFPRRVLLWPVIVQGDGAAEQVAAAIEGFNGLAAGGPVPRPDVLIVARGGGSLEDLMAFNEEIVVRAAAASRIPLISAVGHETDTTLIDHAADRRAPTPTAAAEMAVPVRAELVADLKRDDRRLTQALVRSVEECRARVTALARGLGDPRRLVEDKRQRLDDWGDRLHLGLRNWVHQRGSRLGESAARLKAFGTTISRLVARDRVQIKNLGPRLDRCAASHVERLARELTNCGKLLESFSYERVLERGFVLATDSAGRPVQDASATRTGMSLKLRFHDGSAGAVVTESPSPKKAHSEKSERAEKSSKAAVPSKQGSLL